MPQLSVCVVVIHYEEALIQMYALRPTQPGHPSVGSCNEYQHAVKASHVLLPPHPSLIVAVSWSRQPNVIGTVQGFIHDFTSGGVSKNQGVPLPLPSIYLLSLPSPPLPSLPLEVAPLKFS